MSRVLALAVLVCALLCAGCTRHDTRLAQHAEQLASLSASAHAVCNAWLGGNVSGTFTRTALERTYQLTEQERTALAGSPQMLSDPRGARLSQTAERMSRLVALLIKDVRGADAAAVRQRLAQLPVARAES